MNSLNVVAYVNVKLNVDSPCEQFNGLCPMISPKLNKNKQKTCTNNPAYCGCLVLLFADMHMCCNIIYTCMHVQTSKYQQYEIVC